MTCYATTFDDFRADLEKPIDESLPRADEFTRQEIAKMLNVSPARVSQYQYLPPPSRRYWKNIFYNKEAVLKAIQVQRYGEDRTGIAEITNEFMRFMAGQFDPEEKIQGYDLRKQWAHTHPPKTTNVRLPGLGWGERSYQKNK